MGQFIFVTLLMASDNVGISFASGGQLTSLGNVIVDWSRTTENRPVAYALTLATAIVGAAAAGGSNVLGWWKLSIRHSGKVHSHTDESSLVLGLWAIAFVVAGWPVAIALKHQGLAQLPVFTSTVASVDVAHNNLSGVGYATLGLNCLCGIPRGAGSDHAPTQRLAVFRSCRLNVRSVDPSGDAG